MERMHNSEYFVVVYRRDDAAEVSSVDIVFGDRIFERMSELLDLNENFEIFTGTSKLSHRYRYNKEGEK